MEGIVDLGTLAKIGVTLVGFSSLVVSFRGSSLDGWHPRAILGFWCIISYGLGTLFFALLPTIMADLGSQSWTGPMFLLALFHLITTVFFLRRHFQLLSDGCGTPNNWSYYIIAAPLGAGTALVLLLGALGIFNEPGHSLYRVGVIANLLLAVDGFVSVMRLHDAPDA